MSKKQADYQKELQKCKKDLTNIKDTKEVESKGLGQELNTLRNSLKEK